MNKTTAFIFFGIILVGLGISIFTLKGCGEKKAEADAPVAKVAEIPATPAKDKSADPDKGAAPAPETVAEKGPASASAGKGQPDVPPPAAAGKAPFSSPEAAMAALAEKIAAKDFASFSNLVGPEGIAPPIRETVKGIVENPGLRLDPTKPQVEISKSAEGLRWAFNLVPATGEGAVRQLYADLKELPGGKFDIAKVSLPLEPTANRGAGSPADPEPANPAGVTRPKPAVPASPAAPMPAAAAADALTVAHAFSKAVVQRDFKTARELADPATVTDERVAALMIAVEEGKFALKEDRPLVVTLSREDITWVLARVQSGNMASEFAVELGKIDQLWKVNGLTFSKVLSALSESAGGGDVAYSPIVEDPEGGDSLVLYFEFDQAGLTQRAQKQLAIVADILSQGAERVIRINGHADALGTADYNVNLSDRRAEAIREALVNMGVKPEQVVTEAFGSAKPRKPNFLPDGSDNPSGRSQNRRAEVLLDF